MNSEIEVGYELEFFAKHSIGYIKRKLNAEFKGEWKCRYSSETNRNDFFVHYECLETHHCAPDGIADIYESFEIATPVLPLRQSTLLLRRVLAFLQKLDIYTHEECGIHVNMGFSDVDKMKQVDFTKLVLFTPETKIQMQFQRSSNWYCESLRPLIHRHYKKPRDIEKIESILRENEDKYSSHINKGEYIEFRLLGGPEYEKRFKEIQSWIFYFAKILRRSMDSNHDTIRNRVLQAIAIPVYCKRKHYTW